MVHPSISKSDLLLTLGLIFTEWKKTKIEENHYNKGRNIFEYILSDNKKY